MRSWVGKIGVGIDIHFLSVGKPLVHSTVQLIAASLALVEVTLNIQNMGITDRRTHRQTNSATKNHRLNMYQGLEYL
jgi:hypothetical protein